MGDLYCMHRSTISLMIQLLKWKMYGPIYSLLIHHRRTCTLSGTWMLSTVAKQKIYPCHKPDRSTNSQISFKIPFNFLFYSCKSKNSGNPHKAPLVSLVIYNSLFYKNQILHPKSHLKSLQAMPCQSFDQLCLLCMMN